MIYGIGIDLVEIARIKTAQKRNSKFAQKTLSNIELELFQQLKSHRQNEFLAGRFAAKEAFSKALGSGVGKEFSLTDLIILPNKKGAPTCQYSSKLKKIITKNKWIVNVSITHTKDLAQAIVIISC